MPARIWGGEPFMDPGDVAGRPGVSTSLIDTTGQGRFSPEMRRRARAITSVDDVPIAEAGVPMGLIGGAAMLLPRIAPRVAPFVQRALPWIGGAAAGAGVAGMLDGGGNGGGVVPYEGGVPFEGPGLREPSAQFVVKEWKRRVDSREGDYNLQFYLVKMPSRPYRIYMYSQRTGAWKSWGLPRPAVIGKNMPSHKMITRLRRNLKRHEADAKTITKIANPLAYARQLGYRKPRRRR